MNDNTKARLRQIAKDQAERTGPIDVKELRADIKAARKEYHDKKAAPKICGECAHVEPIGGHGRGCSKFDDTKVTMSLATYFEILSMTGRKERVVLTNVEIREIQAALNAVEAVRAFPIEPPREPYEFCKADPCGWCDGYRDGVEAVQDLLLSNADTSAEKSN